MRYLSVSTTFVLILIVRVSSQDNGDAKPSKGDWKDSDNLAEVLYNLRDIKKDEELVCSALKMTDPSKLKINITNPFDYDQMLQFLVWTMKHDFKSGKAIKFSGELEWKNDVVETISTIFKKGCASGYVPESFVNIIKAMFMVYMNSLPNAGVAGRKDVWKSTLEMLKKCSEAVKWLELDTNGHLITELGIPVGDGNYLEGFALNPQEEVADNFDSLDLVVDTVWHFFSFAFGTCYPFMQNKAVESAQLKDAFLKDFLNDLTFRWREGGGPPMMYGPIFGDMNLMQAIMNCRTCVEAAYLNNKIADRQLVRPLELSGHNDSFPQYNTGLGIGVFEN